MKTSAAHANVSVVRLGRADWRVTDTAELANLLGFIERQAPTRFEITWMTDPIRWGYARSFEDALVAFSDSARFTGEILAEREWSLAAQSAKRREQPGRRAHRATWLKRGSSPTAV